MSCCWWQPNSARQTSCPPTLWPECWSAFATASQYDPSARKRTAGDRVAGSCGIGAQGDLTGRRSRLCAASPEREGSGTYPISFATRRILRLRPSETPWPPRNAIETAGRDIPNLAAISAIVTRRGFMLREHGIPASHKQTKECRSPRRAHPGRSFSVGLLVSMLELRHVRAGMPSRTWR